jgi:hypothetical protein
MSTILYNMLQYCSVLYNMKYLIVMHWFSDVKGMVCCTPLKEEVTKSSRTSKPNYEGLACALDFNYA